MKAEANRAVATGGGDPCEEGRGTETADTNPINISNGNNYLEETDYVGTGPFPIRITRYYNSLYGGWSHSYRYALQEVEREIILRAGSSSGDSDPELEYSLYPTEYFNLLLPDGKSYLYEKHTDIEGTWGSGLEKTERWLSYADVFGEIEVVDDQPWRYVYHNSRRDETVYFNGAMRPVRIVRKDGFEQTLEYADGKAIVTDPLGNQAELTMGPGGGLKQVDIGELTFDYRNNKVTYPDGSFKQYRYSDDKLVGIIDENGIQSNRWTYDNYGMATSSSHADGADLKTVKYEPIEVNPFEDTSFKKEKPGQTSSKLITPPLRDTLPEIGSTVVTNEYGLQERYHSEKIAGMRRVTRVERLAGENIPAATRSKRYYEDGTIYQRTDWQGRITEYEYDAQGRVSKIIRAKGTADETVTTQSWNAFNKRTAINEPGRTTTYSYNDQGLLTGKTINNRSWTYTYNDRHLLTRIDGPRTDVDDITQFSHDAKGRITNVTNALGQTTELRDYNDWNLPTRLVDANGIETELTYDCRGRLVASTRKTRRGDITTTFTLDAKGQITAVTLPNGVQLFNEYDDAGRLVAVHDADGNRIEYAVDAAGNRTEQRHKDASGQLIYQQRYLYDELGRLSRMLGANGESTRYQYDASGNLTHTEDANANPWQNQYDHLNRLTTAYDPTLNEVQFGYDKRGNLTQVTDQRGLVTEYRYDVQGCTSAAGAGCEGAANALDQVTQITSPDTGTQTLSYDKAGNLNSSTDANGQTVNYSYDALNRLTRVQYANHSQYNIQYDYDQHQLDNQAAPASYNAGIGRLTGIVDASGSTALRYDDQGNIHTRIEQRNGGPQLTTGFDYDEAGNLTAIEYPDGSTLTYQRNHLAQINAITYRYDNNGTTETITLADNIQYQGFGQLTALTYGNGLQLNRHYDLNGRLSEYSHGNLQQTLLRYDAVSNITSLEHSGTAAPQSRDYEYDAVNRLVTELMTDGSRGFEYDEVGNRLLKTATEGEQTLETDNYNYADTSNRLQAVDTDNYQYDANGNLLARGSESWTYNARNRMATYSEGGMQQAAYTYNAQGERVKKTLADGATVHYQYNGVGQLMAEYRYQNGSQTESKQYVWLGMMPVAVVVADNSNNKSVYYLHSDHLATARLATDEQQGVVWQWESSAFGEDLPVENGLTLNLRFPGQYYDQESGLNYNYFRDYDARLGRYVQSDPRGIFLDLVVPERHIAAKIGVSIPELEESLNHSYVYVKGDPLNFSDLTGEGPFGALAGFLACTAVSLTQTADSFSTVGDYAEEIDELNNLRQKAFQKQLNSTCINDQEFYGSVVDAVDDQIKKSHKKHKKALTTGFSGVGASFAVGFTCALAGAFVSPF